MKCQKTINAQLRVSCIFSCCPPCTYGFSRQGRPDRAFCGARTKSAGLMPGSEEAIVMYYALAAGLCAVLDRRWPGSMLGSADFVRCRSGLWLGFWRYFCIFSSDLNCAQFLHPVNGSKLRCWKRDFGEKIGRRLQRGHTHPKCWIDVHKRYCVSTRGILTIG